MEFQRKIRLIEERLVELKYSRPATAESPAIKVKYMQNHLSQPSVIERTRNCLLRIWT